MRAKSASLSSAGGSDPAGRAVSLSAPAAETTAIMADKVTMIASHRAVSPAADDFIMSLLSLAPAQQRVGFDCVRRFLHFNAAVVILVHLIEEKGRLAGELPFIATEVAVAVEVGGREIRRGEFPRARGALREVHGGPVAFTALARAGIGVLEACPIDTAGTFAIEGYALDRAAAAVRLKGDLSAGRCFFRFVFVLFFGFVVFFVFGGVCCLCNYLCFYVHRWAWIWCFFFVV